MSGLVSVSMTWPLGRTRKLIRKQLSALARGVPGAGVNVTPSVSKKDVGDPLKIGKGLAARRILPLGRRQAGASAIPRPVKGGPATHVPGSVGVAGGV